MTTLYSRLLEICEDRGMKRTGTSIAELFHLSSGRPSQIKSEGEAARLGEESVAIAVKLGYSRDWVQEGKLPKLSAAADAGDNPVIVRQISPAFHHPISAEEESLLAGFRHADESTRNNLLLLARRATELFERSTGTDN